jgi:hypothetical protein
MSDTSELNIAAHKMMGSSSGTFSAPYTSIERKKEQIAE